MPLKTFLSCLYLFLAGAFVKCYVYPGLEPDKQMAVFAFAVMALVPHFIRLMNTELRNYKE